MSRRGNIDGPGDADRSMGEHPVAVTHTPVSDRRPPQVVPPTTGTLAKRAGRAFVEDPLLLRLSAYYGATPRYRRGFKWLLGLGGVALAIAAASETGRPENALLMLVGTAGSLAYHRYLDRLIARRDDAERHRRRDRQAEIAAQVRASYEPTS